MPVYLILATILLGGCSTSTPSPPEIKYVRTECPKFNASVKIYVGELNATHGSISWVDVAKIESLLKEKRKFNRKIKELNSKI